MFACSFVPRALPAGHACMSMVIAPCAVLPICFPEDRSGCIECILNHSVFLVFALGFRKRRCVQTLSALGTVDCGSHREAGWKRSTRCGLGLGVKTSGPSKPDNRAATSPTNTTPDTRTRASGKYTTCTSCNKKVLKTAPLHCNTCGHHYQGTCWGCEPDKAPEWWRLK